MASGRLLAYSPATQQTRVVMDGLLFANGVAVAHDGSYVLVVDTGAWKVWKVWLRGPQARPLQVSGRVPRIAAEQALGPWSAQRLLHARQLIEAAARQARLGVLPVPSLDRA